MKLPGRLILKYCDFFLKEYRAGVQAFIHAHDGETGLGFVVEDSPLYGRSSPIFGQKGCMNVNDSPTGYGEKIFFQDLSKGNHDGHVRLHFSYLAAKKIIRYLLRL